MRRAAALLLSGLVVLALVLPAQGAPGVSRTTIKIGLHAPLTGAAPVPADSMEKGKDLYFRWLAARGVTINGRTVKVILKNDQYNPSMAVAVCKEMIERNNVFMLTGFTGADQIVACARFAASVDAPYVAPGTTTAFLKKLPTYFAASTSWPRQGSLLADFLIRTKEARAERNGIVYYDTPTHRAPVRRFKATMSARDADVHYERAVSRAAGTSEARLIIEELRVARIENVFVLTTPVFFLNLLHQASTQDFYPLWSGIGLTMTHDTVAEVACRDETRVRARFFSPYPAYADRDRFDPDFDRAVARFHGGDGDDFMWQLWAQSRVLKEMLERPARRLTRDRFVSSVERSTIRTGIVPKLVYRPNDHFGGAAVHVLKIDCSRQRWVTGRTFVRDF